MPPARLIAKSRHQRHVWCRRGELRRHRRQRRSEASPATRRARAAPASDTASSIIASLGLSTGIGASSRAQASIQGPKAEQVNRMPSAPHLAAYRARSRKRSVIAGVSAPVAGEVGGQRVVQQVGELRFQATVAANDASIGAMECFSAWISGDLHYETAGCSVVGSIILRTSVILVAGKPLISACLRMMSSSLAR